MPHSIFSDEIAERLIGQSLYYPCSARDLHPPIQQFASFISHFWFVDLGYFTSQPASEANPTLKHNRHYRLLDVSIKGPDIASIEWKKHERWDKQYRWIEPCIRTETYECLDSGRIIYIHRRRGFGFSGLKKVIDHLGVFYYRRDSNDGGSGTLWLIDVPRTKPLIREVIAKLVDGGLIVTDGSNMRQWRLARNPYKPFCQFHTDDIGAEAVNQALPFTDNFGNLFRCIGYAGEGYGPTLIWQVTKNLSKISAG